MARHKHADVIHAWAEGAEVQYKALIQGMAAPIWKDILYPVFSYAYEYRVKPKTIKYRNYLWKSKYSQKPTKLVMCICSYEDNQKEPREKWNGFVKWIGDWQEVEV